MTVSVGITIKNAKQFRDAFNRYPAIVRPHLDSAIKRSVLMVGRSSRQLTPVDTGRLRASHLEVFKPLYGEVGTHVNYDVFVHEGTRYMRARPFMQDAVNENKREINNLFTQELQEALHKIGRLT